MTVSSNSCHRYSTTLKITIKGSSITCSLISFLIWHFLCAIQAEHFGACCLRKIIYSVVIVAQLDVKPNPITVIFLQHTSKHTLLFFFTCHICNLFKYSLNVKLEEHPRRHSCIRLAFNMSQQNKTE